MNKLRMNRLIDGTEYRTVNEGYVLRRGKREIYIIAKSVAQGEKARELIGTVSFNRLFNKAKAIKAIGYNTRAIYL